MSTPIDEPHYIVSILGCPQCEQRYVSVFAETVDWVDGEDPQQWQVMPVSPHEAVALIQHGSSLRTDELLALPPRRSLVVEHRSGAEVTAMWGHGIHVTHHE